MSDFADDTKKIDIGNEKFIEIKSELSFEEILFMTENKKKGEGVLLKGLFPLMIKDWNLEKDGKKAEVNLENILKLKKDHVQIISKELMSIISIELYDKKKQEIE